MGPQANTDRLQLPGTWIRRVLQATQKLCTRIHNLFLLNERFRAFVVDISCNFSRSTNNIYDTFELSLWRVDMRNAQTPRKD